MFTDVFTTAEFADDLSFSMQTIVLPITCNTTPLMFPMCTDFWQLTFRTVVLLVFMATEQSSPITLCTIELMNMMDTVHCYITVSAASSYCIMTAIRCTIAFFTMIFPLFVLAQIMTITIYTPGPSFSMLAEPAPPTVFALRLNARM